MRRAGLAGLLQGFGLRLLLLVALSLVGRSEGTHCWRRKYYISFTGRAINATLGCDEFFQWTVSDYCCYDGYDRSDMRPYCCRSETFKLLSAVGTICGTVLGAAAFLFVWWYANLSHHLLRLLTCGKFNLNAFVQKRKLTGPYVDPSFYAGEPFWTPSGSEMYLPTYPLRPMPPRIFYPALPSSYKGLGRWSGSSTRLPHGQMPLFVLASRQFTRKPYSARPNQGRTSSSTFSGQQAGTQDASSSRRSSTSSTALDLHNAQRPSFGFRVHMDEVEAAAELLEALKNMEEKGEKAFTIPRLQEETQGDLELESELMDGDVRERQEQRFKDYLNLGSPSPSAILNMADTPFQQLPSSRSLSAGPSLLLQRAGSTDSSSFALDSILEEQKPRSRLLRSYSEEEPDSSSNIPGFIPDPEQDPGNSVPSK